jgi:hypothetical protein
MADPAAYYGKIVTDFGDAIVSVVRLFASINPASAAVSRSRQQQELAENAS